MAGTQEPAEPIFILAKIRPSARFGAGSRQVDLEPLLPDRATAGAGSMALDSEPRWYLVRAEEGATPWDMAHGQLAAQLGIDGADLLFAEPDIVHTLYPAPVAGIGAGDDGTAGLGIGERCEPLDQDADNGKPVQDGFAWHLGAAFTQIELARSAVTFTSPATRVAHIDTGYYPAHQTVPANLNRRLQRNFVARDGDPSNASDPDNDVFGLDNSGHGAGTLSILAGGPVANQANRVMGGVPRAEIVAIRVADTVALIRTSALARGLRYAADARCAVATLSMGGLPTRAWAEVVDDAYLAGLCLCAAAGNHPGPLPPRRMVYPARYDRVIGVVGVMADGRPYKDLGGLALEGSYGPASAMATALAAFTPNIPWAVFGCPDMVRLNGEGTSAAAPQVAAAAALWIEKYKTVLPADWRRVEAVRHALFSTARSGARAGDGEFFGRGILQAHEALSVAPRLDLPMSRRSDNSWAFLRMLTGLGISGATPREEMFNLELAQRWLVNDDLQEVVPDPDATAELTADDLERLMKAVLDDDGASVALRRHVAGRYSLITGRPSPSGKAGRQNVEEVTPEVGAAEPDVPQPPSRRLRVYAKDPTLLSRLDTSAVGQVTLSVPWETLKLTSHGFEGEYLAINDQPLHDGRSYGGVNLNDENLLAQDGWEPSEANAQFHQQMVYAVAAGTVEHFERALGRPVMWRPRPDPELPDKTHFVRRLEIRPHALTVANAFYSPEKRALLFGSFPAPAGSGLVPGSPVFTCLSHDIIAHETAHALLDGMHESFHEASNVDVLAFHEGFADLVALLQSFEMTDLLEHQILSSRGDLEAETMLGMLAIQVGNAAQGRGALRSAIGTMEGGHWKRSVPDPGQLARTMAPHARGAVLVAAVFDALIAIYEARTADLRRIATGGTGRLPDGAIHPDLARRMANEAAKTARHVLGMCIRALDYLPPVDVTFFDFLRALITADFELVPDDRFSYRVAFVESFARRAIFPGDHDRQEPGAPATRALSPDTLRWTGFTPGVLKLGARGKVPDQYGVLVEWLRGYDEACQYLADREKLFTVTAEHIEALRIHLEKAFEQVPTFATSLGLERNRPFEVAALRRAARVRSDGRVTPEVIVALTQSAEIEVDQPEGVPAVEFRGGTTLVVDLTSKLPKYLILKGMDDHRRRTAVGRFAAEIGRDPLKRLFLSGDEPFAALHELADESGLSGRL